MKIIKRNDYKTDKGQENNGIDSVDRSGYIPPDVKYLQMVIAGKTLEIERSALYDYSDLDEQQEIRNKLISPNMDKLDAIDIAKYYEKDLKKYKSQSEHVEKLAKEYEELKKIEDIKRKAVEEYRLKRAQEKQSKK